MKDNDKIKDLIKLSEENPDMEIYVYRATECNTEYPYERSKIVKIEICDVYNDGELDISDEDEIFDIISNELELEPEYEDHEYDKAWDAIVEAEYEKWKLNGDIKTVIVVYVG